MREAGEILGVASKIQPEDRAGPQGANKILEYIFRQIVNFKKLNQDPAMDDGGMMGGAIGEGGAGGAAPQGAGAGEVWSSEGGNGAPSMGSMGGPSSTGAARWSAKAGASDDASGPRFVPGRAGGEEKAAGEVWSNDVADVAQVRGTSLYVECFRERCFRWNVETVG